MNDFLIYLEEHGVKFTHVEYLYFLGIIPILILCFFIYRKWQQRSLLKFCTVNLKKNNHKNISSLKQNIKDTLKILSILFLIIGLSNPKIGSNKLEVKREGIEIIIALDISNSMLCEDIKPNRLSRSIQAISNLIDNLQGDKIGLVVFAGEAYTQLPITTDYSAAKMFLSTINTKIIKSQGTNIASAIEQSMNSFNFENELNKSIIIITDGEDHETGALIKAEQASEKGVFIYTLSIGDTGGGPIPIINKKGYKTGSYKKDRDGNTIVTTPNTAFLAELSNIGKGKNINANNSRIGLSQLFDEIDKLEKKEISDMIFTDFIDRFQLFLIISFIFLFLDLSITNKKNNIFDKLIKS